MNMKKICVSVLIATGLILGYSMQGCSVAEKITGSDSDRTVDPGKVVEIQIYDPDLDETSSLTIEASNSSQCQQAIRDIKAKDYESAKRNLTEQLAKSEKDFKAWYALGALHERENNFESALKCYQSAVKTDKKGNAIYVDAIDRVINRVDD